MEDHGTTLFSIIWAACLVTTAMAEVMLTNNTRLAANDQTEHTQPRYTPAKQVHYDHERCTMTDISWRNPTDIPWLAMTSLDTKSLTLRVGAHYTWGPVTTESMRTWRWRGRRSPWALSRPFSRTPFRITAQAAISHGLLHWEWGHADGVWVQAHWLHDKRQTMNDWAQFLCQTGQFITTKTITNTSIYMSAISSRSLAKAKVRTQLSDHQFLNISDVWRVRALINVPSWSCAWQT